MPQVEARANGGPRGAFPRFPTPASGDSHYSSGYWPPYMAGRAADYPRRPQISHLFRAPKGDEEEYSRNRLTTSAFPDTRKE